MLVEGDTEFLFLRFVRVPKSDVFPVDATLITLLFDPVLDHLIPLLPPFSHGDEVGFTCDLKTCDVIDARQCRT